jgi:hypothetical protein
MIDKFEEILSNLKERLTSPLISSFIIAWLIFNWRIVIGLFWHESEELNILGYTNYFDLITSSIQFDRSIFNPLFFALGYTFVYPILKNLINAFLTWTTRWGDNWNLRLMKNGSIPVDRYLQLKKHYDKRTTALEEVIKSESVYVAKIGELESELSSLKIASNIQSERINTANNELQVILQDSKKKQNEIIALKSKLKNQKTEINETHILSDKSTIFFESPSFPNLPKNKRCVEPIIESWEEERKKHVELADAKWISHSELLTLEEAQKGGIYLLKRNFDLERNNLEISSAVLYFMADDFVEISLNGKYVGNGGSHDQMHSRLVNENSFEDGLNEILFRVKNSTPEELDDPANNPYGIIFSLVIKSVTFTSEVLDSTDDKLIEDGLSFLSTPTLREEFESMASYIQRGFKPADNVSLYMISYFENRRIVRNVGQGLYEFTELGIKFLSKFYESGIETRK